GRGALRLSGQWQRSLPHRANVGINRRSQGGRLHAQQSAGAARPLQPRVWKRIPAILAFLQRLWPRLEWGLPAYPLRTVARGHDVFSGSFPDGNIADLRPLQGAGVDRIAGRTQRLPDLLRHQPRLSLQFRHYSRGRQPAARSIVTTGASAHVLEPDLLLRN